MHPRVARLPQPAPDFQRFLRAVRREPVDRVPLIELAVDQSVVAALLDEPAPPVGRRPSRADVAAAMQRTVRLHHRLGYDVVRVSAPIPFSAPRLQASPHGDGSGGRQWQDAHHGPLQTVADCERYAWPRLADIDFAPVEAATAALPDGMALIGFSGGVLEFATDLMGLERFLCATRREPDLARAVVDRVGRTIYSVFEVYCEMDAVCALWLGDDLGHKHGPLLSPRWMRERLIPWYARFADLAHRCGRPFLLHSCGDTGSIMPAIVDEAGIDAKHSFEDGIQPVERFLDAWGDRVSALGGVDMHLLAAGEPAAIRRRTLDILTYSAQRGGYAAGSGNSIADYVPPENFLAMVEAAADFNRGGG